MRFSDGLGSADDLLPWRCEDAGGSVVCRKGEVE